MKMHASQQMPVVNLTISAVTADYTILGASYSVPTAIILTINTGILVYSDASLGAVSVTGTFPAGSTLLIVNNGAMMGHCGAGGNGSGPYADGSTAGGDAGNGLYLNYTGIVTVTLDNTAGYFFGGGGGGGGGARAYHTGYNPAAGGGGGQGCGADVLGHYLYGPAGTSAGGGTNATDGAQMTNINQPYGTRGIGGNGEISIAGIHSSTTGGYGGDGGDFGVVGSAGGDSAFQTGSAGGAAGKACYIVAGSLTITAGNNGSQVKGALA